MIESQLTYVMDALGKMDARGAAVAEALPEAQESFNLAVQEQTQGTVWTDGGCASWYLDRHGRNTVIWPGTSWSFRQATRAFDPSEYVLEGSRSAARQGPVFSAGPNPARKSAAARQP